VNNLKDVTNLKFLSGELVYPYNILVFVDLSEILQIIGTF